MECREWRERISASIDGEIPPGEARLVEGHLEECPECRALERKMRAVGIGVARTEGVVPPEFREKLFARMEAEELLPRRRSLFVYSLRWAAIPVAAAAAMALFLLASPDKGKDSISPQGTLPQVAGRSPAAQPGEPASPEVDAGPKSPVVPERETMSTSTAARTAAEPLTPEEREIIAHLDILEDPSDLDPPGDVDEMEMFAPPGRRHG